MSKKHRGHAKGDPVTYQTPLPAGGVQMETFLPWTLVRRGLKKQIITPLDAPQEFLDEARRERQAREMAQDTPLMRALGLAHHWQRLLDEDEMITWPDNNPEDWFYADMQEATNSHDYTLDVNFNTLKDLKGDFFQNIKHPVTERWTVIK